jgi:hypothetical protein
MKVEIKVSEETYNRLQQNINLSSTIIRTFENN